MGSVMDLSNLDLSKIDPSNFPSAKPPEGVQPNFVNPESRATATIVFSVIFTCFMLVIVSLRMYTKAFVVKQWHWDDCKAIEHIISHRDTEKNSLLRPWNTPGCFLRRHDYIRCVTRLTSTLLLLPCIVFEKGLGPHQWDVPLSTFLDNNTFRVSQLSDTMNLRTHHPKRFYKQSIRPTGS